MKSKPRYGVRVLSGVLIAGAGVLSCASAQAAAQDNGIPALLQFSQQYQSQQARKPPSTGGADRPAQDARDAALSQKIQTLQAQLKTRDAREREAGEEMNRLLGVIRDLEARQKAPSVAAGSDAEVATLKKSLSERDAQLKKLQAQQAADADRVNALTQQLAQSRLDIAAATAALNKAKTLQSSDDAAQKTRLAEAEQNIAALTRRLTQEQQDKKRAEESLQVQTLQVAKQVRDGDALKTQLSAATKRVDDLKQQLSQAATRQQTLEDNNQQLTAQVKAGGSPVKITADSPVETRQSYAIGVSLGRDVIQQRDEHAAMGIKVLTTPLLAGITDAYNGKTQMTDDAVNQALHDSEVAGAAAIYAIVKQQKAAGDAYIKTFSQRKGAKKFPDDVWYRVTYPGKGDIAPDAIVDLVVTESLTDGTIVHDMEASGKTLSLPLEKLPDIFRQAIGVLKNHGEMTMVVPPEKAYGDRGLPPVIPPGTTMIYKIRIDNIHPAATGQK